MMQSRLKNSAWLVLLLCAGCATTRVAVRPERQQPALRIAVVDVGQGEGIIIQSPTNTVTVLDAGVNPATGTRAWNLVRDSFRTRHVDYVFASHYHIDHIGGLPAVLDSVYTGGPDSLVQGVFDRGGVTSDTFFVKYEKASRGRRHAVELGRTYDLGGGATLRCVCMGGKVVTGDSVVPDPGEENSRSLGFVLQYGDFKMSLTNDLAGYNERYRDVETLAAPLIGKVSVMYVNHHGSRTSCNDYFLETLHPQASVISCGADNPYGHPHPKNVSRLTAVPGNRVYQTTKGTGPTEGRTIVNGDVWIEVKSSTFMIGPDKYSISK